MTLGYLIWGVDTKDYYLGFQLEFVPSNPCNRYKSIYDINFLNENFKLPRGKKKDFYTTKDGFVLVSENVKIFCEENKYENLEFKEISEKGYYWLKTNNTISYDFKTRKVWFKNYNRKCKGYEEIIGATPVCLTGKLPLGDGFFKTDICFGGYSKSPLLCIGSETFKKIEISGFKGFFFEEIQDKYHKLPDMGLLKKATRPGFSFLDLLED